MNVDFLKALDIKETDNIFVTCNGKTRIEAKVNQLNYKTVELKSNANSTNIGMIIPTGFIAIDADTEEDSNILYETIKKFNLSPIILKTRRGMHFIFRTEEGLSQMVGGFTPIGVEIDTRIAGKGYIVLPEAQEVNFREYLSIPQDVSELPEWLIPKKELMKFHLENGIKEKDIAGKKSRSCFIIDEGSRNDLLLKYSNFLGGNTRFDKDTCEVSLNVINMFLFKSPIEAKEVKTIVDRTEYKMHGINKTETITNKDGEEEVISLWSKKPWLLQKYLINVSKDIIKKYNIKMYQEDLFMFTGKKYSKIEKQKIKNIMLHEHDELIKSSHREEIHKFIYDYVEEIEESVITRSKEWIATPSEVINLKTLETKVNNGKIFNVNNIDYDFKEIKENEFVDNYMKSLFTDDDTINLIYEMIGYGMLSYSPFRKAFYLIGPAQTGKSFFLDIVKKIFGQENISAIDPAMIDKDPRLAGQLQTSLINAPDDLARGMYDDESNFKKLVSGELMEVDQKYKNTIKFTPSATFIMTSNYRPTFRNKDAGIYSRLVFIDFENKIKGDPDFIDKWEQKHYEYIVYKSIMAINSALRSGELTIPNKLKSKIDEYIVEENPVIQFYKNQESEEYVVNAKRFKDIYSDYKEYCKDSGYSAMNQVKFKQETLKHTNYELREKARGLNERDSGQALRIFRKE